jgi:hypothetical protein
VAAAEAAVAADLAADRAAGLAAGLEAAADLAVDLDLDLDLAVDPAPLLSTANAAALDGQVLTLVLVHTRVSTRTPTTHSASKRVSRG